MENNKNVPFLLEGELSQHFNIFPKNLIILKVRGVR